MIATRTPVNRFTYLSKLRNKFAEFRARRAVVRIDRTINRTAGQLAKHIATRKNESLGINQLLQLDDAMLKDIGLTRTQVLEVKQCGLTTDALGKSNLAKANIVDRLDNATYSRVHPKVSESEITK